MHDEDNSAPELSFERIGHTAVGGAKGVRVAESLDMAVSRAQQSLCAFALRRILLELLQKPDAPMTIAAIWGFARLCCGHAGRVDRTKVPAAPATPPRLRSPERLPRDDRPGPQAQGARCDRRARQSNTFDFVPARLRSHRASRDPIPRGYSSKRHCRMRVCVGWGQKLKDDGMSGSGECAVTPKKMSIVCCILILRDRHKPCISARSDSRLAR